jgi:hypothetical protein
MKFEGSGVLVFTLEHATRDDSAVSNRMFCDIFILSQPTLKLTRRALYVA